MTAPRLVAAGAAHGEVLAALHGACFDDGWDAAAIRRMLAVPGTRAAIAVAAAPEARTPDGFVLWRRLGDEAEVLALAVRSESRRRGVARALMAQVASAAAAANVTSLVLEVAADNAPALAFYAGQGFRPVGRRRGYYRRPDGAVDAHVLRRRLSAGV